MRLKGHWETVKIRGERFYIPHGVDVGADTSGRGLVCLEMYSERGDRVRFLLSRESALEVAAGLERAAQSQGEDDHGS